MMDPLALVVVYDSGNEGDTLEEPGYVVIAHNLIQADAQRLQARMESQYDVEAEVILHRNHHTERNAPDCGLCHGLIESLIDVASESVR